MSNASNADPRPTLEAPDDDPWIWLEDIDSPQAVSWVEARNAKTLERFGGPRYLQDRFDLRLPALVILLIRHDVVVEL